MGILSKIFKKKEEIPEESPQMPKELGMAGRAMSTDFEPVEMPKGISKEDLIITKLDMISMRLDNLDRRVQYIEKVAKESEK